MEAFLLEKRVPKVSTTPVDLNTGANTGARIDIRGARRVSWIVVGDVGTTTTTHTFSLKQHDAASAGNSKALSVDNKYFHKIGAATAFTEVEPASASDSYDLHALLANNKFVLVMEVLEEQLDTANGYGWVSLDIADTGGAQLGSAIALVDVDGKPAFDKVV